MTKFVTSLVLVVFALSGWAIAGEIHTFGSGENQFNIEFVTISGDAVSANGTRIGSGKPGGFTDPGYNYLIGVYQVTNAQWSKFENNLGISVAANSPKYQGQDMPVNTVNWYEMAQFVNWLNTSNGYQEAYNFTGTQGTNDYTWGRWSSEEAMDGTHNYRHKDAFYFLPTVDEWVKAAYWNGDNLQTWATKDGLQPTAGIYSNYDQVIGQPWNVGSGLEELNGTYNMMGNLSERTESPYIIEGYDPDTWRIGRGGTYNSIEGTNGWNLQSDVNGTAVPHHASSFFTFRVAAVPEPATVGLLALGGLAVLRKKSRQA